MDRLFYYNLDNLLRIMITAPIMYVAVVAFIRVSGKRTMAQMNNFDWIVTVAMGSLVASSIVFKDVTIIEVLLAMIVLLAFQVVVTKFTLKSERFSNIIKAQPKLLVYRGEFLEDNMSDERVSNEEICSVVRKAGIASIDDVLAVTLETDGSVSVLPKAEKDANNLSSLGGVDGMPNG
ncbi:MAG: DUF421 domain-containing protein [Woeseia sp.]|nr:DUF421 domain-containing protein [Woeseia sp.]